MNHMQKELRRAAARAFMESLEQLETRLGSEENANTAAPSAGRANVDSRQFAVAHDFEEAVADIEQHIRRL
jgi:hypothetical protein